MDQVSSPGKTLSSQVHTRKLPANAQQVAEIFKATGEAFSAIGDCVMMMDHKAPPKTKVSLDLIISSEIYSLFLVGT